MSTLKKSNFSDCVGLPPYEQDITLEAVRQLQEEADKDLAGEEWILVEEGSSRPPIRNEPH